jgi:hypothetical protein
MICSISGENLAEVDQIVGDDAETGTIGEPAAVIKAVLDALKPAGRVADIRMSATPPRLWRGRQRPCA